MAYEKERCRSTVARTFQFKLDPVEFLSSQNLTKKALIKLLTQFLFHHHVSEFRLRFKSISEQGNKNMQQRPLELNSRTCATCPRGEICTNQLWHKMSDQLDLQICATSPTLHCTAEEEFDRLH